MFNNNTSFNQDLTNWFSGGPHAITNMSNMFKNTTAFNRDLSPWIITGANISGMFSNASGLSSSNKAAMRAAWITPAINNFSDAQLTAAGL